MTADAGANGTDLLVVGGGLEGYVSALAAARERPDSAVRLVEPGPGRFRRETGSIDLLGYTPDGEGPVREPFAALPDLPADHPYSRVGVDAVRRSLSFFADVTSYDGSDSEANALVPTCNGSLKPTYLYPPSVTEGLASDRRETLLVGFDRVTDFDAELAAARLDDRLPYDLRGTTLTFPGATGEADSPVRRFAEELDDNEPLEEGPILRRALAGKIRSPLDIEPRIGFPAVLGRQAHEEVRDDLAAILQADLFEVPLGPPSVPGMRLGSQLRSAVESAGVDVVTGASVTGFGVRDGRIERVHVSEMSAEDANGAGKTGGVIDRTYEASSYVLATGGLASSGLESDRRQITEPAFDCHVPHPGDRADWVAREFLGDQPFARFGLDVDHELRPVAADGRPEYDNLHAAGTILGGGDFAAEQSSGGVAIATGYRAGRVAV